MVRTVSLVSLLACAGCPELNHNVTAVWSDDGLRTASLHSRSWCFQSVMTYECDPANYSLRVSGSRLPLNCPPQLAADLYYMRSAGVVMYGCWNIRDGLSGTMVVDSESGDELWVASPSALPSPDGVFTATPLGDYSLGLAGILVQDLTTGEEVDRVLFQADEPGIPGNTMPIVWFDKLTWLDNESVALATTGGEYRLWLDGRVERITMDCWWPRTSSSAWNDDGENARSWHPNDNTAGDGEGDLDAGWCPHSDSY